MQAASTFVNDRHDAETYDDRDGVSLGRIHIARTLRGDLEGTATAELTAPDAPGSYSYRCAVHPARMRGVLVVLGRDTEDPNAQAAAPPAAPAAPASGGSGPGGGVTAFVLAAAVVAAFLGGIGVSALALRRRAAT